MFIYINNTKVLNKIILELLYVMMYIAGTDNGDILIIL